MLDFSMVEEEEEDFFSPTVGSLLRAPYRHHSLALLTLGFIVQGFGRGSLRVRQK